MSTYGFHDAASAQMKKSLEHCTSDLDRYTSLWAIADMELEQGGADSDHIGRAYEAIKEALVNRPIVKEGSRAYRDRILLEEIQDALVFQMNCEVQLSKLDDALASINEARSVFKENPLGPDVTGVITTGLEKESRHEMIMSIAEQCHREDLMGWLGKGNSRVHAIFQHAAVRCAMETALIRMYQKVKTDMDEDDEGAYIRLQLAEAYRFILGNHNLAKHLLEEVINGRKDGNPYYGAQGHILPARCGLAELYMEQFRNTIDPREKSAIYDEMKKLVLHDRIAVDSEFSPFESQTAIPLALMAQKLGPMCEFQDTIDKAFRNNVKALCDTAAWNDWLAF